MGLKAIASTESLRRCSVCHSIRLRAWPAGLAVAPISNPTKIKKVNLRPHSNQRGLGPEGHESSLPSSAAKKTKHKPTRDAAQAGQNKTGIRENPSYFSSGQKNSLTLLFCFPAQSPGKGAGWGHIWARPAKLPGMRQSNQRLLATQPQHFAGAEFSKGCVHHGCSWQSKAECSCSCHKLGHGITQLSKFGHNLPAVLRYQKPLHDHRPCVVLVLGIS